MLTIYAEYSRLQLQQDSWDTGFCWEDGTRICGRDGGGFIRDWRENGVKGRVRYKKISPWMCPWMEVMRTLSWGCEHGNQIAVGWRVGGRWASEMVVSEKEERRAHSFRWLIYLDRRPLYAEGGEYLEERRDIWWSNISTWEKSPFWCLFVFHCIISLKMICLLFLVEWYVAKHSVHKA